MEAVETEPRPGGAPEQAPELPLRRILVVMLAWMAAWWAIVGALLAPVLPGGWLAVLALALVGAAPLAALVRGFVGGAYPSAPTRLWVLRPFWYVQLVLPLVGAAGALGALAGLPFSAAGTVGRGAMALTAAVLASLALAGYAGSRWLVVRHLDVLLDGLPAGLDGLRIVQISDLHVGPHTSRRFLRRVAAAVRDARPDVVVSTGDQVDDYARDVHHFAAALEGVDAPLGVFAIAGNHDVYAGWAEVRRGLERQGIRMLVNDAVALEHRGVRFWIAGTGDPAALHWTRGGGAAAAPDLERALAGVTQDQLTLVLAHNPALWPALARLGAALTLSGHTHHGQFSIPRLGWSLASPFLEYAMGVHSQGESLLYVHPGTNYWGIPFRIGALPEVAVLTLRPGPQGSAIVFRAA
jgi:predicted MPP superfamily phosphohydrolase